MSRDSFRAMAKPFHSLRMHASREGTHISGGERLLGYDLLEDAALALFRRALRHPRGRADKIHLCLEQVPADQIARAALLPVTSHCSTDWKSGRALAAELLTRHGLSSEIVSRAIDCLAQGPGPGGCVMRGAVLMDASNGQRLEPDSARGVRVSRMDLAEGQRDQVMKWLDRQRVDSPRVVDALLLASKVALYPQIVAELCWSDDPDYVTGYVASKGFGYHRITPLKADGDPLGGRVFFIRDQDAAEDLIVRLQQDTVLFSLPENGGEFYAEN